MASITSTTGLISGIKTSEIIDQLMTLEAQPKTLLQNRVKVVTAQKTAYKDMIAQLESLRTSGRTLVRPTTFNGTAATSSNENVLTATTAAGAPVGTYQFQVARLVTSQQNISKGFADFDKALVGAGTITVEMGGGEVTSQTLLSDLNGGVGINRGKFRITDRTGSTSVIDVTNAVSLDDVVKKINTSLDISIRASISGDKLVLSDTSGSSSQQITVVDLADGTSAKDLGIAGTGSGTALTGTDINFLSANTALTSLNDGRGVRTTSTGAEFSVTTRDGSTFNIELDAARTLGDVLNAINTLSGGKIKAEVGTSGQGLKLIDNTTGGSTFAVAALNSSLAAKDLGLLGQTASSGVITGKTILASVNSVLVSSLNGGAGLTLGNLDITDRSGTTRTIDLSSAETVQSIVDQISSASGIQVTAKINASGNGISIVDDSGGSGNLTIGDNDSTNTATALGMNQSIDTSKTQINGKNLQRQWISENSLLSKFNGGKGVTPGTFKITNAAGGQKEFNFGTGTFLKLSDVISAVNVAGIGVTASINANGDGLLLTDTSGGAGKMKVENVTGTTATDLRILGEATGTTINGSFEKTIDVTAADTLTTLSQKIQTLGFGVKAAVINDGSSGSPYRLSLNAVNTGRAGRIVVDGGTTGLDLTSLVEAQDAAVFVGGATSTNPLLVTASGNSLAGVLPGVTLNLNSISESPVTLSITRDSEAVVTEVKKFAETFNTLIDKIADLTKFDSETNAKGLLLGDSTTRNIQSQMYASLNVIVSGAGQYRIFADVGVRLDDETKIDFDEDKFRTAYADDPEAVKNLFTQTATGLGAMIEKKMDSLVDPVNGAVVRQTKTLDSRNEQFQSRISALDKLLESKRLRLETQFANMESVLAKLQSQQQSLSSLTGASTSSN